MKRNQFFPNLIAVILGIVCFSTIALGSDGTKKIKATIKANAPIYSEMSKEGKLFGRYKTPVKTVVEGPYDDEWYKITFGKSGQDQKVGWVLESDLVLPPAASQKAVRRTPSEPFKTPSWMFSLFGGSHMAKAPDFFTALGDSTKSAGNVGFGIEVSTPISDSIRLGLSGERFGGSGAAPTGDYAFSYLGGMLHAYWRIPVDLWGFYFEAGGGAGLGMASTETPWLKTTTLIGTLFSVGAQAGMNFWGNLGFSLGVNYRIAQFPGVPIDYKAGSTTETVNADLALKGLAGTLALTYALY